MRDKNKGKMALESIPCILTSHLPPSSIQFALQRIRHRASPDNEPSPVAAASEVGEEAFDNVRLGGENVDGVHVRVHLPPVLDALDI